MAELLEDVPKGALRGGGLVDMVGCEGQVLNHAQHLAQYYTVLRPQAPRMHCLQCPRDMPSYNPACWSQSMDVCRSPPCSLFEGSEAAH